MGYADDLGDYRALRDTYGGKAGQTIADPIYSTFTRLPGFRTGDWVKVVVAPPPPPPLITTIQNLFKPTAPPPPVPSLPVVAPPPPPRIVPPPPLPVAPTPAPTTAQAAAPIVSAAAAGVVGPIAAAIPPIVDAASQPSPMRIRIVPDAAPSVSLSPADSASDTGAALPVAGPAEASITDSGSPLDMLKSLPPSVLAAGAGLVLFLFSRSQRRR